MPAELPDDSRPDYDSAPRTEYTVTLDDGVTATVTDSAIAEKLTRSGYDVSAVTGYLG